MRYRVCERCGAHIDPGEICDCEAVTVIVPESKKSQHQVDAAKKRPRKRKRRQRSMIRTDRTIQGGVVLSDGSTILTFPVSGEGGERRQQCRK